MNLRSSKIACKISSDFSQKLRISCLCSRLWFMLQIKSSILRTIIKHVLTYIIMHLGCWSLAIKLKSQELTLRSLKHQGTQAPSSKTSSSFLSLVLLSSSSWREFQILVCVCVFWLVGIWLGWWFLILFIISKYAQKSKILFTFG